MNFKNSISLNFPAIMLETLERFKSFMKRFIFPKFHETFHFSKVSWNFTTLDAPEDPGALWTFRLFHTQMFFSWIEKEYNTRSKEYTRFVHLNRWVKINAWTQLRVRSFCTDYDKKKLLFCLS